MSRVVTWLQVQEVAVFRWANGMQQSRLGKLLVWITHLGGATATILFTLLLTVFATEFWRAAALQSLIALSLSHLPVAIVKKKYPRLRPYLVLPHTNLCSKPLKDHSFPSGHTTAIFSVVVPFVMALPILALILIPLACTVAFSRMYLGLHYPSDCAAGAAIGTLTASLVCRFIII